MKRFRVLLLGCAGLAVALSPPSPARAQEGQGSFAYGFQGPDSLAASPGETASGIFYCTLTHSGDGVGAEGWCISLISDNALITAIGIGVRNPPGLEGVTTDAAGYLGEQPFHQSEITRNNDDPQYGECAGRRGAISCVVPAQRNPVTLPPEGTFTIAAIHVESTAGPEPAQAVIRYADGCARGEPVANDVTQSRMTVRPVLGAKAFHVVPAAFRRGDSNSDGRVDISDAIRILMYLFLGAGPPGCLDAADANDDSGLDVSDPLRILNDYFIPFSFIPDPGRFRCGADPTGDALSCESPPPCP